MLCENGWQIHSWIKTMYKLIQQDSDWPETPVSINNLFLDTETTSFDPKKTSLDVWKNCWIAGIVFSWDDHEDIYFVPVRYRASYSEEHNVPVDTTIVYVNELFRRSHTWVNHNIKYDYHVLSREGYNVHNIELFDTLTQAKLIASDRFFYNEDSLAADWLEIADVDIHKQAMKPWIESSKDWGEVPISKMFPYACHDVEKNRLLFKYIQTNLLKDFQQVSLTEQKVTRCLCRCEQVGLSVNVVDLLKEQFRCNAEMLKIMEEIRVEHNFVMRPNVNADCYQIFHKQYGLPVVGETDKGDPSYDKFALATLKQYPDAPVELIDKCIEYRKLVSHNGFMKSYTDHELDGRMHASYNQCVRTGRMSCSEPNMQQLNKEAKRFIQPPEGYVFLSFDFSAIEFRIIAHYLGQPEIIQAYQDDPDTDFHQWVADMCGVARKPAKNINFCMAFGGGKGRVLSMLSNNADVIEDIHASSPEEFESLCRLRAEAIYNKYHSVLHRLRPLTGMAANRLKAHNFVKNAYGRHRHLPKKATYRALNSVIQSSAADCMKEAVVKTCPLYNTILQKAGVEQVAYVHDEILFICPKQHIGDNYLTEPNPVIQEIAKCMLTDRFTVPLRVSASIGEKNWADLVEIPKELIYEKV